MRLRLFKEAPSFDYFNRWKLWLGISALMMVVALGSFMIQGLNYGIDFRGGTTIRTESPAAVNVAEYRAALEALELGDISITEVFDPSFREDQNVSMIRIQAQEGQESVSTDLVQKIEHALGSAQSETVKITFANDAQNISQLADALVTLEPQSQSAEDTSAVFEFAAEGGLALFEQIRLVAAQENALSEPVFEYDNLKFISVESVGPKVSGELIQTAAIAVILAISAVLIYIWLRFEWQFAAGAVLALIHDVMLTIGVFSELQIRFDLAIIAALLTIVGYSLNDTVVVFDRVRENLRKYKKRDLKEVMNLSINETMSRTFMTSFTTLIALIALFVLGGDVIRGFVFAMIWGVIVGTYSSIFVASAILLYFGVKRDWSKPDANAGNQYANIDA